MDTLIERKKTFHSQADLWRCGTYYFILVLILYFIFRDTGFFHDH